MEESKEGALVMLIKKIASKGKEGELNEAEKVEHTLGPDSQKKGGGRKSAKKIQPDTWFSLQPG